MTRGGKRENAGRKKGGGKFGEETKPIRIPVSKLEAVYTLLENRKNFSLPLFATPIKAGFPSPADDYIETHLDLNEHLIQQPAATFFLKASGDSMINAGINSGDILVVDRSIKPSSDKIVIASINGELTVKRLFCNGKVVRLLPENSKYEPIEVSQYEDLVIWGVVTYVIHKAV